MTFAPTHYLDLNRTEHRMLFDNSVNVWDALKQIPSYLQFRLKPQIQGRLVGKPFISGAVFIGKGSVIGGNAFVTTSVPAGSKVPGSSRTQRP